MGEPLLSPAYVEAPATGRGLPQFGERIATLLDRRFHIGHFVVHLPDNVHWSPEMYELTGRPDLNTPLTLADLIEPFEGDDRVRFAEIVGQALRDKTGCAATLRLRRTDGSPMLVEVAGDVILEGERLLAFVGAMRPAPVHFEDASGDELAPVAAAVKTLPIPAVLTDTQMRIVAHSSLWSKTHGVTATEIIGADLISVVPKAPVGWALEHAKAVAGQVITSERLFFNPATSRQVRCMASLTPCVGSDGAVHGVITAIGWADVYFTSKDVAAAMKGRVIRG